MTHTCQVQKETLGDLIKPRKSEENKGRFQDKT